MNTFIKVLLSLLITLVVLGIAIGIFFLFKWIFTFPEETIINSIIFLFILVIIVCLFCFIYSQWED